MRQHPASRPGTAPRVQDADLSAALATLNARAWGISVGLLMGLGLFISTNVLVLRGGEIVGPHLGLLGVFLPGYRVTFLGSLILWATNEERRIGAAPRRGQRRGRDHERGDVLAHRPRGRPVRGRRQHGRRHGG